MWRTGGLAVIAAALATTAIVAVWPEEDRNRFWR
jgi:hypothetical protein